MSKRLDVRFASGADECSAWLYVPASEQRAPVVILGHGLGAIREMRLDAFATRFCAAGYACLVFDYRHFGASGGLPRQLLDIDRQLEDWAAATAFCRERDELDPTRIVLWGTSFGGGHAIITAAQDPEIAAVIAQCPFTDGPASARTSDLTTSLRVVRRAIGDLLAARRGKPPVMIATAGAPGSTALMTAPDAAPGYLALVPEGTPFRNEVAARVALKIGAHMPGRRAAEVRCPILFCICDGDSVAPAAATQRHARTAPRAEIRVYSCGHFDIYAGQAFEQAVTDQLAFLKRHVAAASSKRTKEVSREL